MSDAGSNHEEEAPPAEEEPVAQPEASPGEEAASPEKEENPAPAEGAAEEQQVQPEGGEENAPPAPVENEENAVEGISPEKQLERQMTLALFGGSILEKWSVRESVFGSAAANYVLDKIFKRIEAHAFFDELISNGRSGYAVNNTLDWIAYTMDRQSTTHDLGEGASAANPKKHTWEEDKEPVPPRHDGCAAHHAKIRSRNIVAKTQEMEEDL